MKTLTNGWRFFEVAVAVVSLAHLAGCSGCGKPQPESHLTVGFSRWTDGQQLAALDRSDFGSPGFPVDVEALAQDTLNRGVTLQDAQLELRTNGATDFAPGPSAQLDGARAVFPGTALGSGYNVLRVTVTEKDTLRQAARTILVVVPPASGCAISFTIPPSSPFVFNLSFDEDPSTPGLQTTIRGATQKCQGFPVTLYKSDGGTLGTSNADVNTGAFAIPITLQDLEQTRLTAQMADPFPPNPISSVSADVSVKITPPAITNPSPTIPAPFSSVYYVADSNIHVLQPGTGQPGAGYIVNVGSSDADPTGNFGFTVANASGGNAVARLVYRGADLATPVPITTDPQTINWPNVSLPQQTSGLLQLMATDSAGNVTVRSANATVDVVPPAASSIISASVPAGGARTATANLSWTPSGDDGLTGTPAGYDVRWSTSLVLRPDAGYFDPNQFAQAPGSVVGGNTTTTQLSPLPPLNTYQFQVRPFDGVGNYARTSPQWALPNMLPTITLNNPDAGTNGYGVHLAKADFNGDGADDLVVGTPCLGAPAACATTLPGTVYVHWGGVTFGSAPPQALIPPDGNPDGGMGVVPQIRFFGADVSTGNVGDVAGDVARPDLVIGQPSWHYGTAQAGQGRVFIFFGRTNNQFDCCSSPLSGPTAAHAIEIHGRAPGTQFGAAAQVIPDLNGDGLSELLISAPFEDRVYLFYGRSESAWRAIRTQDCACGSCLPGQTCDWYVPASAADRIFLGDPNSTPTPPLFFGRLNGYANLGDISGDGGISFTIPASLDNADAGIYVYTGPVVNSVGLGGMLDAGMASQRLFQATPPILQTGSLNGFGARAFGGVNLVGGPALDLVVTHPKTSTVYIYPDGANTQFSLAPQSIVGTGNMGFSLSFGDINGDGRPDIVTGENRSSSSVWLLYTRGTPNAEFDSTAGAGFWQSQLTSSSTLGIDVVVGDFNGDGKPDIAAGDFLNGNGVVTVWY